MRAMDEATQHLISSVAREVGREVAENVSVVMQRYGNRAR